LGAFAADAAIIDFTEAAYDLERGDDDWLSQIVTRGLSVLDQGLGVGAVRYGRPPERGPVNILQLDVASGPEEFRERHLAAVAALPVEFVRAQTARGVVSTMSELARHAPEALATYTKHVDYCRDLFAMTAIDPSGAGVAIVAPLAEETTLAPQDKHRWEMLAAHLDAGHRLRRSLGSPERSYTEGALPRDAEAIFDPASAKITDAVGKASERAASEKLREAAVAVDKARGKMRKDDPQKALETWRALVRGRWSTVDWFDTDGRRYVLALPNSPEVNDPRGLTERERQVVAYAAMGQTNKLIGYRLGLSRSRISLLLRSAMRKLNVRTRTQLISRVREFESIG